MALAAPCAHATDFSELTLEELGNIRITSVSKVAERLSDAAASVYVINRDDIRRSGARTIPEALRLAPNLQVAQVSAAAYSISARGMNGSNNSAPNKLLVLLDGRSVYSPLFSGVFWDVQDLMLEDIERIEVISGPGGTLWGVNAVNGVINIITREAARTQGELLVATTGNRESDLAYRHGGRFGNGWHYRVYGKHLERDHTVTADGEAIDDATQASRFGFRLDWNDAATQFGVHGTIYEGTAGQPKPGLVATTLFDPQLGDVDVFGANLTVRWDHQLGDGSSVALQAYYARTEREVPPMFSQDIDIVDLQLQHALRPWRRHALIWGANLRYSRDRIENSVYFAFLPARVNQQWSSVFLQDEIALRDNLKFTLGARVERNDYTGIEWLPSARIAWRVNAAHMLWAAASRAVRAPSRLDGDAYIPGEPPFLLNGGDSVRSEVATVFEMGYRTQPSPRLSYSVTAFHVQYDDLRTQEIDPGFTFVAFANGMRGRANGIEMWGSVQVTPDWRVLGGYTALDEDLWLKPGSNDLAAPLASGNNPSHTAQVRSSWKPGESSTLDIALRRVSALTRNEVPAYTAVDARFGWNLPRGLDLSLTVRNLLGRHAEYGPVATRAELGRSVYLNLRWTP